MDELQTLGGSCKAFEEIARNRRSVAAELAALGDDAIPEIEAAISSVADEGEQSPRFDGTAWLLLAYAKIKGPVALARLQPLLSNPKLAQYRGGVEQSISLALGLTSYVASPSVPDTPICLPPQPRDSLDRIILAWEQGDRAGIEAVLGPRANSSFRSLLGKLSWTAIRRDYWHHDGQGIVAVGYRFETVGPWSKPAETLQGRIGPYVATSKALSSGFDTQFTTGAGRACGGVTLRFNDSLWSAFPWMFRVDCDDVRGLLHLIDSCATPIGNR
ncbi:MAG TPA: hypothetical protein VHW09_01955 [Bryobacteraceae bacterium]|jgi:hypothetical protein|nr:hypothetical protein [Bryobacteraceae bacterium]